MTREQLGRLYALRKEIKRDEKRLKKLDSCAERDKKRLSDMRDKGESAALVVDYESKIADLKIAIFRHCLDCIDEEKHIIEFMDAVPDPLMRTIIKLRNIDLLTWRQVAEKIGGGNTENGVKQMYCRFLKTSHMSQIDSVK